MEDIKIIDALSYLFTPAAAKAMIEAEESKIIARDILKTDTFFLPIMGSFSGRTAADVVSEMDKVGYEKIFLTALKMWSYRNNRFMLNFSNEEIYDQTSQFPERIIGLAGYNPFRIEESLREVEKGVKELGFKGVYVHVHGYGIKPTDRRMYPLYAKCVELDIPVSIQVGHSLEIMPSEVGRPIYLDDVALDFPKLKIIASHTGWPWCEELIALASKHKNLFIDISAHMPKYLDPSLIKFMDTRGRNKTLFATNGLDMKQTKEQFMSLPLKDETKRMVLRENAVKLYKL